MITDFAEPAEVQKKYLAFLLTDFVFLPSICTMTDRTDPQTFAPTFQQGHTITAAPLEHGKKYEDSAILGYFTRTGNSVMRTGLEISAEWPYIGWPQTA